ncbi:hypothetical protein M413DRAFT_31106 [Hebeloma cylindrosporum]|uniref:Uncharacterized protein n=1 Tax=Hebeloma cylindrosporum TaxID=76867 RepID=A0A0C3C0I4_HEBCY|nr:hypothetical protein M413DRAFT_31106 [Hebeloma cylindrosporum h7]
MASNVIRHPFPPANPTTWCETHRHVVRSPFIHPQPHCSSSNDVLNLPVNPTMWWVTHPPRRIPSQEPQCRSTSNDPFAIPTSSCEPSDMVGGFTPSNVVEPPLASIGAIANGALSNKTEMSHSSNPVIPARIGGGLKSTDYDPAVSLLHPTHRSGPVTTTNVATVLQTPQGLFDQLDHIHSHRERKTKEDMSGI